MSVHNGVAPVKLHFYGHGSRKNGLQMFQFEPPTGFSFAAD